jgi:hypothetical protein
LNIEQLLIINYLTDIVHCSIFIFHWQAYLPFVVFSPACPLKVRVGANSPNL